MKHKKVESLYKTDKIFPDYEHVIVDDNGRKVSQLITTVRGLYRKKWYTQTLCMNTSDTKEGRVKFLKEAYRLTLSKDLFNPTYRGPYIVTGTLDTDQRSEFDRLDPHYLERKHNKNK